MVMYSNWSLSSASTHETLFKGSAERGCDLSMMAHMIYVNEVTKAEKMRNNVYARAESLTRAHLQK
jgi:hypothetical protein